MANKIKIMIDAGHYGNKYNAGAINGYYESNMTWELQGYLKSELESYGFEVGVTREDKSKDLPVVDRGLKSKGYDLFLSLHSNAATVPSVDYVALFHLVDDKTTSADQKSKLVANRLAPIIAKVMGTKQKHQVLTRAVDFDRDGDGQLNDNYYGVLHGADLANTAGVIIEHSFHTNPEACKWLMDSNNLKKLAVEEAKALAELYGMKKITPAPAPTVAKTCTGKIDGYNVVRKTDYLVVYNKGENTGTNKWGTEVAVDSNGIVICDPIYGEGKMAIPNGGYVISGHGVASKWVLNNIKKGNKITIKDDVIKIEKVPTDIYDFKIGDRAKLKLDAKDADGEPITGLSRATLYVKSIQEDSVGFSVTKYGSIIGTVLKKYLIKYEDEQ